MRRIFLVLAVVVPLLGCGRSGKEKSIFDKVEIERLLPLDSKAKTTIRNRETVAKLVEYFPEMGRGKSSDIAGGWKAAYRLRFVPPQGDPIKVTVDSKGELWSEGNGDWRAKPGLKEHLDGLFEKGNEKQARREWSEPVNGLQGRLVCYALPRVDGTEIIGVALELKNVSTEPLAVRNDPRSVHVRLFGPDGTPIRDAGMPRGGPAPHVQWCIVPRGCYLGFSLYDSGFGIPRNEAAYLALLQNGEWILKRGISVLSGTFAVQPAARDNPPKNAWKGQLDLTPLEIEIR